MGEPTLLADITEQLDLGALDLDEAMTRLADLDRAEDVASLAERRTGLRQDEALALLRAPAELPAALLCRALGLGLNGYSAILRMRHRRRRDGRTMPATLLSAYGGIARPSSEALRKQVKAQLAAADMSEP